MKKALIFVFILLPLAAFGFYFFNLPDRTIYNISDYLAATSTDKIIQKIESKIEKKIQNLPPIVSKKNYPESNLSVQGIFNWTNKQRNLNGALGSLSNNSKLNEIARLRVEDMFANGYFEHKSPQGVGASDIAYDVGYEFILIGENIASGNFDGDEALVQAWMDSPGHRANILNGRYTQIGIAAKKGLYNGKNVWLAAQIFGRPLYLCAEPDYSLKKIIGGDESEMDLLNIKAKSYLFEIQEMKKEGIKNLDGYNKKVSEYNEVAREINTLVAKIKSLIETYNSQVKVFNACVQE